jgi:gliding motility-associated-like protein
MVLKKDFYLCRNLRQNSTIKRKKDTNNIFLDIMKLSALILFFVISFHSIACDGSSINIVSQSTNPDGSITYELNLFLDLGGSDVAHYGFTLAFLSASNNPIVMPGGFDPLISQSDLTSGISDDLIGLIGNDVNSIANDTDWAQYENRTDVLSYESNGIFPSASTDYSMTLFVTVMGCVEDIEFDSNTNSGNPVCIYTANTGQVCGGCNVSSGDITITGGSLVGSNEYDLSNCETINFGVTNEVLNGGALTYGWAVFSCEPNLPFTVAEILDFNNNPCYLGSDYGLTSNDTDAGGVSGTIVGGYNQLWVLPYTSDVADAIDANDDGCYDFGDIIQINFIPPSCGSCTDPTCAVGAVNTFEDRTYLSCNTPCAELNDLTYITHHTVTTDGFGNVGAVQTVNFSQFSCSELNRSAVLREVLNSCVGPDIAPTTLNANGVASGFNPEWIGLNPNTNYTLIVTTIIGSDCNYEFSCLDFYGIPGCPANSGNTVVTTSNSGNTDYVLCFNETINLTTSSYTLPDASANSNFGYAVYNCEPTTNNPATDACFTGQYVIGDAVNSVNDGTFTTALLAPDQTVWLVPITMDMATAPVFNHDADGDGCFEMGTPIEITYLNPITTSEVTDCGTGTVNVNVSGGFPEFFNGGYDLINTGAGTLSTTTINTNGGSVTISGLINGDNYNFSITDENQCPIELSGTFTCFECGSCTTPDCLIAGPFSEYETAANPMNQCSQINLMTSNPINGDVFTSYHELTSSPLGTVGLISSVGINAIGGTSCEVSREAIIYPIGGPCNAITGITPSSIGNNGSPYYNPEFTGLLPNTNYILEITFTVPLGCNLIDHCESYYYPVTCQITDLSGLVLNCDPVDNTYSAEITVTYSANPENGTLDISIPDLQSFTISSSPQTVVLSNLPANGELINLSASFSADNNCSFDVAAIFEAPSIPTLLITDPIPVCEPGTVNLQDPQITIGSSGGISFSYWSDEETNNALDNSSAIINSGVYYIQSESDLGCVVTESVTVTINTTPNVPMISGDALYCDNDMPSVIEAEGSSGNYTWYADSELTEIIGTTPLLLPNTTIGISNYFVTATENDCEGPSNSISIEFEECGIIIPSAFTPDGDNTNEVWELDGIDLIYPENKVYVYNRWGNLIFESPSGAYEQNPWNGTFNDEVLPVGSFYYIINYNDSFTDASNGTVSILK